MGRGVFLSLDGLDGTGKSTQCRRLAEWLRTRGYEVLHCIEPGGTSVGTALRELVLHHRGALALPTEALLFMASRAQLVAEVIQPAIDAGKVVISDRFHLATIVYQGYAGGLDVELLRQVGLLATGGLEPDLTLLLDAPLEVTRGRRKSNPDRLESRPEEYHQRVREGFLIEARRDPKRLCVVDATPEIATVHEQICKEVARVLGSDSRA